MPNDVQDKCCDLLQILKVNKPRKYLGLPTEWDRSKREALNLVKERIVTKICYECFSFLK